jgi:hypothetical protein
VADFLLRVRRASALQPYPDQDVVQGVRPDAVAHPRP